MPHNRKVKKICRLCGSKTRLHRASQVLSSRFGTPIKSANGYICENHFERGTFEDNMGKRRFIGQRISPDDLKKIDSEQTQSANPEQSTPLSALLGGHDIALSPGKGGHDIALSPGEGGHDIALVLGHGGHISISPVVGGTGLSFLGRAGTPSLSSLQGGHDGSPSAVESGTASLSFLGRAGTLSLRGRAGTTSQSGGAWAPHLIPRQCVHDGSLSPRQGGQYSSLSPEGSGLPLSPCEPSNPFHTSVCPFLSPESQLANNSAFFPIPHHTTGTPAPSITASTGSVIIPCSILSRSDSQLLLKVELPHSSPDSFCLAVNFSSSGSGLHISSSYLEPCSPLPTFSAPVVINSIRSLSPPNTLRNDLPSIVIPDASSLVTSTPFRNPSVSKRKNAKIICHKSPSSASKRTLFSHGLISSRKAVRTSQESLQSLYPPPTVDNVPNPAVEFNEKSSSDFLDTFNSSCPASQVSQSRIGGPPPTRKTSLNRFPRNKFLHRTCPRFSIRRIQKSLAILYTAGSKGYSILRRYGIRMPAKSTLSAWTSHFQFREGIDPAVFEQIAKETKSFNEFQRDMALLFDETAIQPKTEVDPNLHEALGHITLPNSEDLANKALAVMIRGISSTYKRIIAYHFTGSRTSAKDMQDFIMGCVENLEKIGLKVRILISDMGGMNQALWKRMGLSFSQREVKSSIENPFSPTRKLYFCADIPHLLKNLANALRSSDFVAPQGKIISFDSIIRLFEIQKENIYQLAEKITATHLNPNNFQKMKVSIASQTLSNSVSAALTLIGIEFSNISDSDILLNTAEFIRLTDKWFSILNSRTPALAFSFLHRDILDKQVTFLKKFTNLVQRSTFLSTLSHKPVQNGIAFAMDAILGLINDLDKEGYMYFIPGRISQDALESFFSVLKTRFPNPSASEFHLFMRCAFLAKLDNYGENATLEENSTSSQSLLHRSKSSAPLCPLCPLIFEIDPFEVPSPSADLLSRIEGHGFFFVVGALVHSVLQYSEAHPNHFCKKCVKALTTDFCFKSTDTFNGKHIRKSYDPPIKYINWYHLTKYRQNASLVVPSDEIVDFFLQAEILFRKVVAFHGKNHSNKLHFFELLNTRLSAHSAQRLCLFKPLYCDLQTMLLKKFLNIRFSIQSRYWNRCTNEKALVFASKSAYLSHKRLCSTGLSRWNTCRASMHPSE